MKPPNHSRNKIQEQLTKPLGTFLLLSDLAVSQKYSLGFVFYYKEKPPNAKHNHNSSKSHQKTTRNAV